MRARRKRVGSKLHSAEKLFSNEMARSWSLGPAPTSPPALYYRVCDLGLRAILLKPMSYPENPPSYSVFVIVLVESHRGFVSHVVLGFWLESYESLECLFPGHLLTETFST